MKSLSKEEEVAMVARAQAGDKQALGILWESLRPSIAASINAYLRNYNRAGDCEFDDLYQTVAEKFLGTIKSFDPSRGYRLMTYTAYLITYVGRAIRSNNTHHERIGMVLDGEGAEAALDKDGEAYSGDVPDGLVEMQPDLVEMSERKQIQKMIWKWGKKNLPPTQRWAAEKHFFSGKTDAACADEAGISHQSFSQRKIAAIGSLRKYVKQAHYDIWSNYAAV